MGWGASRRSYRDAQSAGGAILQGEEWSDWETDTHTHTHKRDMDICWLPCPLLPSKLSNEMPVWKKRKRAEDCGAGITPRGSLSHCCGCLLDKLHPTLCDPMDCGPPGSCVHGISQARILEWFAVFFSRGIFPIQGSNLRLLHWQVDSLPLNHQGSARYT